ncbi:MAG TPA: aspartate/glutamate racemase family protein [Acetobacteraceae bacterium]|nr:aspartate/glutamate racemase family protein [Acetobacteraceae bacterium]
MRIWYQSMAPIGQLGRYAEALARHAALACSPGIEVSFHGATAPAYATRTPQELLRYPYAKHVLGEEAIGHALQAEREGHDAFVLGSFSEPFLPEIRSLLEIPVVSMPEAALLLACSLAERFALVALGATTAVRLRRLVARHGVESRVSGIHPFPRQTDESELEAAFDNPAPLIATFTEAAERAVANGADVVIPAEGVLNEVLVANGVRRVDGATVMDCVGAALLQAEMMVAVRKRLGLGVGRRWSYATPPPEILADLRSGRANRAEGGSRTDGGPRTTVRGPPSPHS